MWTSFVAELKIKQHYMTQQNKCGDQVHIGLSHNVKSSVVEHGLSAIPNCARAIFDDTSEPPAHGFVNKTTFWLILNDCATFYMPPRTIYKFS
jgi:hypothetical protein